jgi:CRP-like cAMP-binding protein
MASFIVSTELKIQLERLASIVSRPKGTVLFRRGEEVSGIFLIREGKVNLGLDSDGGLYPTRSLGPGSVLGLPATVSGAAYSLTAEVTEDSELGFVPRQAVIVLLRESPFLCFQVMEMLSDEISGIRSAMKLADAPGNIRQIVPEPLIGAVVW